MSREMELMLRIKAINDASKSLVDVQKELERLEKKKQSLEKTLEKKIKLGVDTKETEENLKLVKDRLAAVQAIGEKKIAERALKEFGENAKKAKNETEEFFRKYQEGLFFLETSSRNVQQALGTVVNYLGGLGQSFIDAAAKSEMMGTAMTTVFAKDFKGNIEQAREAAKSFIEDLKGFALKTPFETDEILQMGIKLKGYGLTVDEVKEKLRQLGDMAAAKNKSLSQAVEAFGDARMSELERLKEFDISRQMIDDAVNGRLSQAKNKAEEMKLIVEGLTSIIESNFKGGMERAAENYQTQVSNLRAAFNELKIELGNELLPVAKEVVGELTELTKWANSFSPEVKTAATVTGAVVTGLALIGTTMAGIIAVGASVANSIIGVVSALGGLNVVLTAASGLWTGISLVFTGVVIPAFTAAGAALLSLPVAIGAVLIAGAKLFTWTQDYRMLIEDLKNQDANTVFSNQAKAMYELHQFYPQITSAQTAFNLAQKEGLNNIAAQENGLEKLKAVVAALTAEEMKLQEERANARAELLKLQKEAEGLTPEDSSYYDYQEKIDAQKAIVEALGLSIGKLREEKDAANDAADAYKNKSDAAGAKTPGSRLTDTEVNEEIRRQNLLTETQRQNLEQQINNLENFKSSYELTEMQILQIDKEIGGSKDEINKKIEQSNKDKAEADKKNADALKEAWRKYYVDLEKYRKDDEERAKEKARQEEESFRKRAEAGKYLIELDEKEKERNKIYKDQLTNLKLQSEQYSDLLDKSTQLYESNLQTLEAYNDILVKRGEKTREAADKEAAAYKKAYSDAWNNEIEPIMDKVRTKGLNSLDDYEKKLLSTGNRYIEVNKEAEKLSQNTSEAAGSVNKITSSMDNVTSGIGKATSAAQGFSNSLSQASEKASQLADKMQTIGNLSASEGGTTPSGLGGFSSSPGGLGQWENPSPSEMAGEAEAAKGRMYGSGNNTATSGGLTTGDQGQLGNIRGYTSSETGVKGSLTASQALEKIQGQYVLDAKTLGQEQAFKDYTTAYNLYLETYYKKQSQNTGQFSGWNSSADVSGYTPFGYGGSSGGFDNPVNDKMAFSLGQKKADAIVNRSEEDLAYFYTAGMVERIKDKVSMAGKPDTVNMSSPVHNVTNNSSNQKSTVIAPNIYINGNQVETTPELKRLSLGISQATLKFAGFKGLMT